MTLSVELKVVIKAGTHFSVNQQPDSETRANKANSVTRCILLLAVGVNLAAIY